MKLENDRWNERWNNDGTKQPVYKPGEINSEQSFDHAISTWGSSGRKYGDRGIVLEAQVWIFGMV